MPAIMASRDQTDQTSKGRNGLRNNLREMVTTVNGKGPH
jgi:hypothetical protein